MALKKSYLICYRNGHNQVSQMLPVYLSDMQVPEESNPNLWQFSLDGHFSVQINHIPGTAKGVDHAGEQ